MRTADITFDELRELLIGLGCSVTDQSDRSTASHPALGSFLFFRPYGSKESVSQRDMVVVRRQLVDNGLIEAADFDRYLHKASA